MTDPKELTIAYTLEEITSMVEHLGSAEAMQEADQIARRAYQQAIKERALLIQLLATILTTGNYASIASVTARHSNQSPTILIGYSTCLPTKAGSNGGKKILNTRSYIN